nr:MAG TPA: hypothetical protein [Caudoviricetes sp.]DAS33604.1 MAG TPA: hypothetical protein [Caudoviricetes sp.]
MTPEGGECYLYRGNNSKPRRGHTRKKSVIKGGI